uniref:Uncharacterized protein n=1 Tax=Heterorhabditis bacteriophora TaxID=37862 RepID=A0A1I7WVQ4_HETBA
MLAETMSSCIVFSDNEDELKAHAGLLDSAHDNISHQVCFLVIIVENLERVIVYLFYSEGFQLISPLKTKATPGQERKISTDYENEGNYFDKDPVFRCLLRDKKRPLQDVFIRPMEPPPKNLNEYEFKLECGTNVFPVKTSQKGFLFYRNGSPVNVTSPSLDTLQTVKRRRDRLLHKALMYIFTLINFTEPVAKKRRIVNQDNGDQIESNMDIPLSNFLTPKILRKWPKSSQQPQQLAEDEAKGKIFRY